MPRARFVVVAALVLLPAVARAEDCATTLECSAGTRCVNHVCTSVDVPLRTPSRRDYTTFVVTTDISAFVTAPLILAATNAFPGNPGFNLLAAVPNVFAAPIVHASHQRWASAAFSFLGWTSVAASSALAGGLSLVTSFDLGIRDEATRNTIAWATGAFFALSGAILMTWLDGVMARSHRARSPRGDSVEP